LLVERPESGAARFKDTVEAGGGSGKEEDDDEWLSVEGGARNADVEDEDEDEEVEEEEEGATR
jgi:hypothetical protein